MKGTLSESNVTHCVQKIVLSSYIFIRALVHSVIETQPALAPPSTSGAQNFTESSQSQFFAGFSKTGGMTRFHRNHLLRIKISSVQYLNVTECTPSMQALLTGRPNMLRRSLDRQWLGISKIKYRVRATIKSLNC